MAKKKKIGAKVIAGPHNRQEVLWRKEESLIEEAVRIQSMKEAGMTIPQIAEKLASNQQNILNRLKLLRLTPEEQQRVHTGKLGMVNASKIVDKRESADEPQGNSPQSTPAKQRRMPTLERARFVYTATEKPEGMSDVEWLTWTTADVRRFVAFHLGVEFTTFEDMVKENQAK